MSYGIDLKKIIDSVCRKMCPPQQPPPNTVTFTDEEVSLILRTRQRLRQWLDLAQAGVIGAPMQSDLKTAIMEIINAANRLYDWYVPPFSLQPASLTESEINAVVNDIKSRGGMQGWLRLDGTYYTTDIDTFKKIVDWDWTDTRKYLVDTFDCDKFAMYFKARQAIDFRLNSIGMVIDYSAGHAYNIIIIKDPSTGKVTWYLYEPQNDRIFTYDERDKNIYTMQYYYLIL
jgi:hypothetical protein